MHTAHRSGRSLAALLVLVMSGHALALWLLGGQQPRPPQATVLLAQILNPPAPVPAPTPTQPPVKRPEPISRPAPAAAQPATTTRSTVALPAELPGKSHAADPSPLAAAPVQLPIPVPAPVPATVPKPAQPSAESPPKAIATDSRPPVAPVLSSTASPGAGPATHSAATMPPPASLPGASTLSGSPRANTSAQSLPSGSQPRATPESPGAGPAARMAMAGSSAVMTNTLPEALELPSSDAQHLNNPKPAYPAVSKRLGERGKVVVNVLIGADGVAQKVELLQSSSFDRLDQSALATALRWRYVPGKKGGVPHTMWYAVPIRFDFD